MADPVRSDSARPDADGADPSGELVVDLDWRTTAVVVATLLALVAAAGLVRAAPRTLTWLAIGGLLALALDPVVTRVETELNTRRGPAVVLVLAAVATVVVALALLLGPETVRQARSLPDDIPQVTADLADLPLVGPVLERNDVPERAREWLEDLPSTLSGETAAIEDAARSAASGLLAAGGTALIALTLLLDGERFARALRRLVPPRHRARADELGTLGYEIVGRYFAGSVFVATLHGVYVLVIGLLLGIPLAPLLAVWAAVFNLVPQIGGAVGGIPFVLFAFTQGAGTGVAAAVAFVLYMNFENHVIQPLIVGDAVDLSPPTTMVAAIVGVSVAGVPGALVAVPLVGVVKAAYLEARGIPRTPAPPRTTHFLARFRR